MPNPYNPNSPYQAAQAFSGLGPALDNIVLGLAQQRYQMAKQKEEMQFRREQAMAENLARQQQLDLTKSHYGDIAKHYEGQNALNQQKLADAKQVSALGPQLGGVLSQLATVRSGMQQNPNAPYDTSGLESQLANVLGQAAMAGRRFAPQNAAQVMELQDPRMRALLATGAKPIQSVPYRGATADVLTGNIQDVMPQTVNMGQNLVSGNTGALMAQGQEKPASLVDPTQKMAGTLANIIKVNTPEFGMEGTPASSNIVSAAQQQLQSILQGMQQGGGRQAQGGSDRVSVISPDGKRGSIPRAQLNEALKSGYKQVQ